SSAAARPSQPTANPNTRSQTNEVRCRMMLFLSGNATADRDTTSSRNSALAAEAKFGERKQ
ncbi:MAG: hypothetical protein RBS05_22035, partial [Zoogloea oleivorans]|uniref:hypothetical protein n=1 Tax=Zoogloea oleivorans TaxID=1552750 RepID=UPI002A36ED01